MTRNEAVFTYSGEEPTVDHAGDLVIDRALDILEKQLDVQLKQLDIIRSSLTTRIFLPEGTIIRKVETPKPKLTKPPCHYCGIELTDGTDIPLTVEPSGRWVHTACYRMNK